MDYGQGQRLNDVDMGNIVLKAHGVARGKSQI